MGRTQLLYQGQALHWTNSWASSRTSLTFGLSSFSMIRYELYFHINSLVSSLKYQVRSYSGFMGQALVIFHIPLPRYSAVKVGSASSY
jgi:hypothetical protein